MLSVILLCAILSPALAGRLPLIVGGEDVDSPGKYPWQASMQYNGQHICGAALVSSRWLVTAAHCVGMPQSGYTIVLGLHKRSSAIASATYSSDQGWDETKTDFSSDQGWDETKTDFAKAGEPIRYGVSQIIKNPGWVEDASKGFPNDIAVMQISSDAKLSSPYISAVEMADSGEDFLGNTDCHITGWGKLGFLRPLPDVLQEANVDVYTNEACESKMGKGMVGPNNVCVGRRGKSGACSGDSGGPLVCKVGSQYKLVGVTSYGLVTCSTNYPSVYSRVSHFRDWIRENTGL